MPVTTLCFKATDRPIPDKEQVEHMLEFLTTDTVCYRAPPEEEQLFALEKSRWDPITDWFSTTFHVHLALTTDITLTPQSQQTIDRVRKHLASLHPWEVPAYQHATASLQSLVITTALMDGGLDTEEAIAASMLETDYQIDRWGEVEWQHTIDRARLSADVAAASLVVREIRNLEQDKKAAFNAA
eukprot:sb/3471425/